MLYREIDDSRSKDSGVATQVCIGQETPEQWHQRGYTGPIVHILCCRLQILMNDPGQVDDQAGRQPKVAQPLAELDSYKYMSKREVPWSAGITIIT